MGLFSRLVRPAPSAAPMAEEPEPVDGPLTMPEQIARAAQYLRDEHRLVTVTVPGTDGSFTSSILKVDPGAGVMLMDELTPARGHAEILRRRELAVSTRLHGIEIRFKGRVEDVREEDGIAIYIVGLPKSMIYRQRRHAFRALVPHARAVPIFLELQRGRLISGRVTDISLTGIGARVRLLVPEDLRPGAHFSTAIHLSQEVQVNPLLTVCNVGRPGPGQQVRIGGELDTVSAADQRQIQRFVADLDRQRRRREARASH